MVKEISIRPLADLPLNLWKFRALMAAIRLEVFENARHSHGLKELSESLNLETDPMERLLNALVSMEFLVKRDEGYFNSALADEFLVKESDKYYGDFLLMSEESDESWKLLDEAIKGKKPAEHDNTERLGKETFTRAMHNNAQGPAKALSKMSDLSGRKHLLDIGGGSGAFSIVLTNSNPGLRATLIEQPAVCETAKGYIKKEGNPGRISIVAGDYFRVDYPAHDIALFGQIFHSNSAEQNQLLLKKAYKSMENGGIVIITEFLLDEGRTGPLFPALFSLNMLKQTSKGRAYAFSEIESWLEKAGFRDIRKEKLEGPHTAVFAKKRTS